jgi:monovalent cation:H+ antiporter-2, CPA2 family
VSHGTFLADLALVLCVAAPISLLFKYLRQPAILGYLLAGVVVGPYTPVPLFVNAEQVAALSEFGVVFVMFSIGLEFSIGRFVKVLPTSGLTALVQISALAWAGYGLGTLFDLGPVPSLFLAGALAISSTMVVAKVFGDRPPEPAVRELVFGVLVVQDVVAIALLAVLSAVAAGAGVTAEDLGLTIFELGGFLLALLVGGLLIVPRLVRTVHRLGNPESIVVLAAALCFGLAALAQRFGYSVALGAFLAGMLTAESGRGHEVELRIAPIKDLFVAVFFVSVGMSVDPILVAEHWRLTLAILVTVVFGQLASVTIAGLLAGNGLRRSVEAGLTLGQIGEFAFIMASIGVAARVVGPFFGAVLVTVATITSFTTPLMVRAAPRLTAALDRRMPGWIRGLLSLYESWLEQLRDRGLARRWRRPLAVLALEAAVLIGLAIGFALIRPRLLAALEEHLGLAPIGAQVVDAVLEMGLWLPFVLGIVQASRRLAAEIGASMFPEVEAGRLDLAAAPRRALIVALQLAITLAVTCPIALFTLPFAVGPWTTLLLGVVVLTALAAIWRGARNLDGHLRASAEVVTEILRKQAKAGPSGLTGPHAALAPGAAHQAIPEFPSIETLLPGLGAVEVVTLDDEGPHVGRTLGELGLQAKTGAAVLALVRTPNSIGRPGPEVVLEAGDALALIGSRDAIEAARALVEGREREVGEGGSG